MAFIEVGGGMAFVNRCLYHKQAYLTLGAAVDAVQRMNARALVDKNYVFPCYDGPAHWHIGRRAVPATAAMLTRLKERLEVAR